MQTPSCNAEVLIARTLVSWQICTIKMANYGIVYLQSFSVQFAGFLFVHNLLQITGQWTEQPSIDTQSGLASVFNGEIYNYKDIGVSLNKTYDSDAASVTGAYQLHGQRFATHLDGEFAIVLLDSKNNKIVVSTDAFGIKPVWVATENGHFAAASYASALLRLGFKRPLELPPNTAFVFDASSFSKLSEYKVHIFDLRQFKTDFTDWNSAFERAIAKRMRVQHNVALALSSGHDSGAIACAIINQNISNYILVSVEGVEKSDVVEERFGKCQPNCQSHLLQMRQQHLGRYRAHLHENAEDYAYIGHTAPCRLNYEAPTSKTSMISNDVAAPAMAYISSEIRKLDVKIVISGTGADETISDYAFNGTVFYRASTFKGIFQNNFKKRNFLRKEEYVAGSYGLETRYPFLDKDVVQEYLWLTADIKNSVYKAPVTAYLQQHNYPYHNTKQGFMPFKKRGGKRSQQAQELTIPNHSPAPNDWQQKNMDLMSSSPLEAWQAIHRKSETVTLVDYLPQIFILFGMMIFAQQLLRRQNYCRPIMKKLLIKFF